MNALPLGHDERDASLPEHVVRRLSNLRKIDRGSYNSALMQEREEVVRRQEAAMKAAESATRQIRRQLDSFELDEATRRAFTDLSDLPPADQDEIKSMTRRGDSIGAIATAIGLARERLKATA